MITLKDYKTKKVHTVPIDNNRGYREWMGNDFVHRDAILQDNRQIFRTLFGKPHWHYRGEFDFHVWVQEYEGETYIVLTAKGKGTCIEMVRPAYRGIESKTDKIIGFATMLLKTMESANEN